MCNVIMSSNNDRDNRLNRFRDIQNGFRRYEQATTSRDKTDSFQRL